MCGILIESGQGWPGEAKKDGGRDRHIQQGRGDQPAQDHNGDRREDLLSRLSGRQSQRDERQAGAQRCHHHGYETLQRAAYYHLGAENLHQLQRAWELNHRVWTSEAVLRHTLYRQETRWPGYYYRADHPRLDDVHWHVVTASRYDAQSGKWQLSKLPVHHIVTP